MNALRIVKVIDRDPVGGIRRWHLLRCACAGQIEGCSRAQETLARLGLAVAS